MALCPDQGILQAYADGELEANAIPILLDHLESCPACSRQLEDILAEDHWLTSIFHRESELLAEHAPARFQAAAPQPSSLLIVAGVVLAATMLCWYFWPLIAPHWLRAAGQLSWFGARLANGLALERAVIGIWTWFLGLAVDPGLYHSLRLQIVNIAILWSAAFGLLITVAMRPSAKDLKAN
jgi:anti-sigma factor RsiW